MTTATTDEIPAIHTWTYNGTDVLILKCVDKDGATYNGFKWPLTVGAEVVAPDWNTKAECGGGLHGWPWGLSIGDGKEPDWSATWLVFAAKPEDVIDLGGKVKARAGRIVYVGDWAGATNHVLAGQQALVIARRSGAASATGESGAASATGDSSAAVVTGGDGKAQCGPFGIVALAWWNNDKNRYEMRCARVGIGDGSDGTLKARVWYRLDEAGEFVEVGP